MERLLRIQRFFIPNRSPHADTWSADARQFIFDKWRETAKRYNFREYDGPPLEPLELFTTKAAKKSSANSTILPIKANAPFRFALK